MIREGDIEGAAASWGCGAAERATRGVVGGRSCQEKRVSEENLRRKLWEENMEEIFWEEQINTNKYQ